MLRASVSPLTARPAPLPPASAPFVRLRSALACAVLAGIVGLAVAPAAPAQPREPFVASLTVAEMTGKQAVLATDLGEIAIDLRPDLAPNHVGLVMQLAADGALDGTTFHRMVRHGIVQGGDPLTADPGRAAEYGRGGLGLVADEIGDARHVRGAVSAVTVPGQPDSGGSQFFICVVDPGLPRPRFSRKPPIAGRAPVGA